MAMATRAVCKLNDEVLGSVVMAHFCLSWKDVYSSQDYYAKPRWYDFYNIRKRGGLPQVLETTGTGPPPSETTETTVATTTSTAPAGD